MTPAGARGTHRWTLLLMVAAGMVLIGGIAHVSLAILEHQRHPEWSAPAYVNLINLVPYLLVAAVLTGLSRWLAPRSGDPYSHRDPPD